MKIRCLMMFKNEDDLLTPWVRYHSALFGLENLYLFDNGSTTPSTVKQLRMLRAEGVSIDGTCTRNSDFVAKGDLFAALIRRMDVADPADFYLALDCDEFVGVEDETGASFRISDIRAALEPYKEQGRALAIRAAYQNIPGSPACFRPALGALTKLFFARDACRTLDHGFHHGMGRTAGEPVTTPLIHVHYHNKPLEVLQRHARQKLEAEMTDLGPAALAELRQSRGPGWHLVDYLSLENETEYRAGFDTSFKLPLPGFECAFSEIGCKLPFSED